MQDGIMAYDWPSLSDLHLVLAFIELGNPAGRSFTFLKAALTDTVKHATLTRKKLISYSTPVYTFGTLNYQSHRSNTE
jgi:hypothetical protein